MNIPLIITGVLIWLSLPRFIKIPSDRKQELLGRVCKVVGIAMIAAGVFWRLLC